MIRSRRTITKGNASIGRLTKSDNLTHLPANKSAELMELIVESDYAYHISIFMLNGFMSFVTYIAKYGTK